MSRVSTYLNFMGDTEEAFTFYKSVFGTDFDGPITRMGDIPSGDIPSDPEAPGIPESERNRIAHIELPILGGHMLMGTDMLESMGHQLRIGNNVTINLEPDTKEETDRLYDALSERGSESTGMQQMPWAYWGCTLDRFGIRWMFNCYEQGS
ncbi:MAG: VOC family protein [Acidimicrobiales bacterium]